MEIVVNSTTLSELFQEFKTTWVSRFWHPDIRRCDYEFSSGEFRDYISTLELIFELLNHAKHSKITIKSKYL